MRGEELKGHLDAMLLAALEGGPRHEPVLPVKFEAFVLLLYLLALVAILVRPPRGE